MSDDKIHKLNVVHPVEITRQDCIESLEAALRDVKAGNVDEIVIIVNGKDGWKELVSPTRDFSSWIGRLEMVKHHWIELFNSVNGED